MLTLRPAGAKLNGKPLSAAGVDRIAYAEWEDDPPPDAVALLERIRRSARRIVAAGLHAQLSLRELSAFEIECITEAVADEKRRERQALAAVIGMAFQQVLKGNSPFSLLPDGDDEAASEEHIAQRKGYADLMAQAREAWKGV